MNSRCDKGKCRMTVGRLKSFHVWMFGRTYGNCWTYSPTGGSRLRVQSTSQSACCVWSFRGRPAGRRPPGESRPPLFGCTARAAPVSSGASSSSTWLLGRCGADEMKPHYRLTGQPSDDRAVCAGIWYCVLPDQSPIFNVILSSEVNDHRRTKLVDSLEKKTQFDKWLN